MTDRITREVTPFVEVILGPQPPRSRLLLQTETGAIFEEDGRAVFKIPLPTGAPARVLLDPDADLYELVLGTEVDRLRESFEVHLPSAPMGLLPRELRGLTLVCPLAGPVGPTCEDAFVSIEVPEGVEAVPRSADEIQLVLSGKEELPDVWPQTDAPIVAVVLLGRPEAMEVLPQLMHAMGSGRVPVREVRLRIDPRAFQVRDLRPPFLSEVVEAVAAAAGCSGTQLARELALRARLTRHGMQRHLVPDPYFCSWAFRGDRIRGLVPATDHFPVPRRASRREILRGTPESEHERLLAYLGLLEDPAPRGKALAARDLFAVSVHFLPNPEIPLLPNHGGISRWNGYSLTSLDKP